MRELTKVDLQFVVSRLPRDVERLLRLNAGKLYVAGGFIRATIACEKISDIDLFGESKDELLSIAKDLTLRRKGRYFETKNAATVLTPTRFPVQFITRWLYVSPRKLVKSFDFTIAQSAIWAEVLDPSAEVAKGKLPKVEYHSLIADDFYSDLAAKRLVYTSPERDEEAGGSMMRVLKFLRRGYSIQAPALAGVMARIFNKIYEGGIENASEVWYKTVINGLLREVDPMIVVDGVDFLDEHEVISNE